ncbi:putative ribosome-binding factor A, mitochondrial [Galleria mellonella]|uniref:Ribosome-binding factor A, mitochondrial n=1 Tax=Galleria mellonella TaxID=7137 RepID=A0A6J1X1R7_GALME|nr:putative ribosome-binding factor A, mitochondrial [Galleria mellonella]
MITFRRFYHVSTTLYSFKKLGIKLSKMVNPKNKKQYYPLLPMESSIMPSIKSLTKTQREPGKQGVRRVAMLNKIFMKQITDIMSTGTVSMDIVGRGIEISKVQITPDLQTVNVYWVCKGDSTDDETESTLKKIAGVLRHELSTLRVMGEVPYIVFVKDKQEALITDLDRRLAIADYGEDYQTTELGHLLKTEFTLDTKLSPEMKAKIKQLEDESPLSQEPIPEMTHNVYGLDHAKIMSRLLATRKRSKDAWSNLDSDNAIISYRTSEYKPSELDTDQQRQQLADFLQKRKIEQNKLHKQLRKSEAWQLSDVQGDDDDEDAYEEFEDEDDYYNDAEDIYNDSSIPPEKNTHTSV